MAINKKFIHFQTKVAFTTELNAGNIPDTSIVFIKDTKEIWTHGQLYSCSLSEEEIKNKVIQGEWLPVKAGSSQGSVVIGSGGAKAQGANSYAEGVSTTANGEGSHTEGYRTIALGNYTHAQGYYNYPHQNFIDVVSVGDATTGKNASVIYIARDRSGYPNIRDPKNGYQYLLGIGGYEGQDIRENMKSVQEVIADLETNIGEINKLSWAKID